MYNVPICKTLKLKKGLLSFYHSCVFLCLNMSHLAQCRAPHLGGTVCFYVFCLFYISDAEPYRVHPDQRASRRFTS